MINKKIIHIIFRLITLFFLLVNTSYASEQPQEEPKKLVMGACRTESSFYGRILMNIYEEAFKRICIELTYVSCVPDKCGRYVTDSSLDGELGRTIFYETIYPELIRVTEPAFTINVAAFSNKKIKHLSSWKSLKGKDYKIAHIGGYYLISKKLENLIDKSNIILVNDWIEGLGIISNNEADIYIGIEQTVTEELKGKKAKIHNIGRLEQLPIYAYFNKKHKLISIKLSEIIKKMKDDGTIKKIISSAGTK